MKTFTKILVVMGVIFVLWASYMQIQQIKREGPLTDNNIYPKSLQIAPDGRLLTPPLSKPVPSSVDMNKCSSCKTGHRNVN